MQRNSIARRSVVGAMEKNNERRISKDRKRFARQRNDLHKVHNIYVDIFSLTNKVEEHCAFPSLLEPYLRLLTIGVFSKRMVRVKISMFIQ